jgi:2-C-methyl-D-erythritol 4-phosphate cytidylyltransferase
MIDDADESIIMVHDGVRCLLTPGLIRRCYDAALEFGTAIPVLLCKDSVRIVEENNENSIVDRNRLRLVQTPQAFHNKILLPAFKIDYKDQFTDEASVVEAFGIKLNLIDGEEHNIKITAPLDLQLAEILLAK